MQIKIGTSKGIEMQTFNEYRAVKKEPCGCNAENYTWDGESIDLTSEEYLDEVQKGSISFSGLAFSALTGTLGLYISYKLGQKKLERAMAGCENEGSLKERNTCLYEFRKKKIENTIKLLSKAKGKAKDPDKKKKFDKEIQKRKDAIGELRINF